MSGSNITRQAVINHIRTDLINKGFNSDVAFCGYLLSNSRYFITGYAYGTGLVAMNVLLLGFGKNVIIYDSSGSGDMYSISTTSRTYL